jgi:hypothetical protein
VTFEELPATVREDVAAYATRGERHPDPEIAAAADEWARETLSHGGSLGAWAAIVVDLGVSTLLGGGGGGTGGSILAKRRVAKRIRRLHVA